MRQPELAAVLLGFFQQIALLSGEPASKVKQKWQRSTPDIGGFHLTRDREALNEQINARTLEMFAAGLVDEIRTLGKLSDTAERNCRYSAAAPLYLHQATTRIRRQSDTPVTR